MIFHFSIPTHKPERVAKVIAELWKGEAFPFFPHRNESWVAFAGDDRNTSVECYPHGVLISPSKEVRPTGFDISPSSVNEEKNEEGTNDIRRSSTHGAIATSLSQEEVCAIGKREGWLARYAQRGLFGVVELWIENDMLFEVLPPELQKQYIETQKLEAWRGAVAAFKLRQAVPTS